MLAAVPRGGRTCTATNNCLVTKFCRYIPLYSVDTIRYRTLDMPPFYNSNTDVRHIFPLLIYIRLDIFQASFSVVG